MPETPKGLKEARKRQALKHSREHARPTPGEKKGYLLTLVPPAVLIAFFLLLSLGKGSKTLVSAGIYTATPLGTMISSWTWAAAYAAIVLFVFLTVRALKRRDRLGVMPWDFLETFNFSKGGMFYSGILTSALALFVLNYFVFAVILGRNPAPIAASAYQLAVLTLVGFAIRFCVALVEESFWRGIVQHEAYNTLMWSRGTALVFSALAFGLYRSALGTGSFFLNFVIGTIVGATCAYLYDRSGKVAVPALARTIYETLMVVVFFQS